MLFAAVIATLAMIAASIVYWRADTGNAGERRVVRVGLYENPPKIYTTTHGRAAGLFVEVLDEIARIEGWALSYQPCQWADCLQQLEQGQLDLMPDVAFSLERALRYDFHAVSVASSWSQVYSNTELSINALANLAGLRIAILEGGIQQSYFHQLMASGDYDYHPVAVASLDQGYAAVVAGKADAVVTNSFFAARNGGQYKLKETPIVFLPSTLYFATGIGRNRDLLQRIDEHLSAWRLDSDSIYFAALRRGVAGTPLETGVAQLAVSVEMFDLDQALALLHTLEASHPDTIT